MAHLTPGEQTRWQKLKPQPKVTAAAAAGAAVTILLWLQSTFFPDLEVPAEVGAAATTLATFIGGWVKK